MQVITNKRPVTPISYDVFLIAGQSNTYSGEVEGSDVQPHPVLDSSDPAILQWGRHGGNDGDIILAQEPLDHIGYLGAAPLAHNVGWGLSFAKMYKANGHLEQGRHILLIPTGEGGTGLGANDWNKGNSNYNDAIARTLAALASGSGDNQLKGILWHQGENDSNLTDAPLYSGRILQMIDDMRTDLGYPDVPFIGGGLMPSWLGTNSGSAQTVNDATAGVVALRTYTGFADPAVPTELTISTGGNSNHYSGRSHRGYPTQVYTDYTTTGLAGRYWVAFLSALTNT